MEHGRHCQPPFPLQRKREHAPLCRLKQGGQAGRMPQPALQCMWRLRFSVYGFLCPHPDHVTTEMSTTFASITSFMLISLRWSLDKAMQDEEPWLCFLSSVGTRVLIVLYKASCCWACPCSRWGEKVFVFLLSFLPPSLCCTKTNKKTVAIAKERSSILQIIAFSARKHVAMFNFFLRVAMLNIQIKLQFTQLRFPWALHTSILKVQCFEITTFARNSLWGNGTSLVFVPFPLWRQPVSASAAASSEQISLCVPSTNISLLSEGMGRKGSDQHNQLFAACWAAEERQVAPVCPCENAASERTVEQAVKQPKSLQAKV